MPPRQPSTARQGRASSAISGSWHGPSVRTQSQRRASVPNIGARTSIKLCRAESEWGSKLRRISLSPCAGRGSGVRGPLRWARETGKYLRRYHLPASLRIAGGPLTLGRFAPSTSPRAAGRGEGRVTRTIPATRRARTSGRRKSPRRRMRRWLRSSERNSGLSIRLQKLPSHPARKPPMKLVASQTPIIIDRMRIGATLVTSDSPTGDK